MPRITARQKVQAYLKKQHSASATQIGRALNLAAPDVRYHLSVLLADGRIVMLGEIRSKGRGRPVKVYGLSSKALGDNLALLSGSLLDELLERTPASKRQASAAMGWQNDCRTKSEGSIRISSAQKGWQAWLRN